MGRRRNRKKQRLDYHPQYGYTTRNNGRGHWFNNNNKNRTSARQCPRPQLISQPQQTPISEGYPPVYPKYLQPSFIPQVRQPPAASVGVNNSKNAPTTTVVNNFIDDGPTEDCVNYDHSFHSDDFDRNIMFSPVPSNSSELEIETLDDGQPQAADKCGKIPDVAPLHGKMADFLKSCREEAVRIRTEKIEKPPIIIRSPLFDAKNSIVDVANHLKRTAAAAEVVDISAETINNKKFISKDKVEEIKQRVIKETKKAAQLLPSSGVIINGSSSSVKVDNTFNKESNNRSWISSSMPSKMVSDDEKTATTASSSPPEETGGGGTTHKSSKVMDEIKRKLQKSLIAQKNAPVILIDGKYKKILLPLNFTDDDYLDQILSVSYKSQSLKFYGGKYLVCFKHEINRKKASSVTGQNTNAKTK